MINVEYFLVALKSETQVKLIKYVEDIKAITSSINYQLNIKKIDTKLLLYNINNTSIQIIMKIQGDNIETKNKYIEDFRKDINKLLREKTGLEVNHITEILFETPLTEDTANKIIITMNQNDKKEFDLPTAINFNINIKKILEKEIDCELEAYEDDENLGFGHKHNKRFEKSENIAEYIKYDKKKKDRYIDDIESIIDISTDIKSEISTISTICHRFNRAVNYIINIEYKDLYEIEIAKIIFAEQYKHNIFSNPEINIVPIREIANPPLIYYDGSFRKDMGTLLYKKDMPVIIYETEEIEQLYEEQLDRFINFINKGKLTFVLLINRSKIKNLDKFNNNLNRLKQRIIYRDISINSPSVQNYYMGIKREIENRGYRINNKIDTSKFIKDIKNIYGKELKVSNIQLIADKIIFKHELEGGGDIINNFNTFDDIEKIEEIDSKQGLLKLSRMVGLKNEKEKVKEILSLYKVNEERKKLGLPTENISMHTVLLGNPGTGKTTFARIYAEILKDEGILEKGDLIEVSRDDLVGKYVGWTSRIITDYFEKAKGSVIFIDEAYLLNTDFLRGYGAEAIGTIVKHMENYRDEVVVIMAGYPNEMRDFINANPGMDSRIGLTIEINDYTANELLEIFIYFCEERGYTYNDEVLEIVYGHLNKISLNKSLNFGNARYVRKMFERIQLSQAKRVSMIKTISKKDITEITVDDLSFLELDKDFVNDKVKRKIGF